MYTHVLLHVCYCVSLVAYMCPHICVLFICTTCLHGCAYPCAHTYMQPHNVHLPDNRAGAQGHCCHHAPSTGEQVLLRAAGDGSPPALSTRPHCRRFPPPGCALSSAHAAHFRTCLTPGPQERSSCSDVPLDGRSGQSPVDTHGHGAQAHGPNGQLVTRELFTHNCDTVTEGQAPWTAQRGASSNRDGWEDSQAGGSLRREGSTWSPELRDSGDRAAGWGKLGRSHPVPGAAEVPGSSRRGLQFAREEGGSARVTAWGRGSRQTHSLFRGTDSADVASCGTAPPRGRGTEGSAVGAVLRDGPEGVSPKQEQSRRHHGQGQGNSRSP